MVRKVIEECREQLSLSSKHLACMKLGANGKFGAGAMVVNTERYHKEQVDEQIGAWALSQRHRVFSGTKDLLNRFYARTIPGDSGSKRYEVVPLQSPLNEA